MKKILFVLVCVLAVSRLSAQQPNISNPGFEQWSSGVPAGWSTSISGNINVSLMGVNIPVPVSLNFGSQSSDSHSGNYALKLKANGIDLSSYGMPAFTLPGIAQLGNSGSFSVSLETIQQLIGLDFTNIDFSNLPDINWEELASLGNILSPGEAFSMVPTAMKVWIKYLPPTDATDTMLILVGAYKTGEPNMILLGQMPESYGYQAISERIENYTEITVPMSYDLNDLNCDSMVLVFVSSSFMNPNRETELYIDDISFEYDYLSISSTALVKMQLYPNPAKEYMVLSPENQSEKYNLLVYDVNGKLLREMEQLTGDTRIGLGDLSSGAYFIKVQQSGNETVRKFVVE